MDCGIFLEKNSLSHSMSFTSNAMGGFYLHGHKYGIRYGEYYGSINIESLFNQLATGDGWNKAINIGSVNLTHTSTSSSGTSSIARYETVALTKFEPTMQPYIAIYFWKRTA